MNEVFNIIIIVYPWRRVSNNPVLVTFIQPNNISGVNNSLCGNILHPINIICMVYWVTPPTKMQAIQWLFNFPWMSSLVVTMPISPNVLKLVGSLGLLPKKPLCPLYCITQRNHMSVPSNIFFARYLLGTNLGLSYRPLDHSIHGWADADFVGSWEKSIANANSRIKLFWYLLI